METEGPFVRVTGDMLYGLRGTNVCLLGKLGQVTFETKF